MNFDLIKLPSMQFDYKYSKEPILIKKSRIKLIGRKKIIKF